MYDISKSQAKIRFVKYILLVISLLLLAAFIMNFYVQTMPVEAEITEKAPGVQNDFSQKKLPKGYSLSINKSVFEGFGDDLLPYRISAESVVKNAQDEYLLSVVRGTYQLDQELIDSGAQPADGHNRGILELKSDRASINEETKSAVLKDNVEIFYDQFILNSEAVTLDLKTQDAQSKGEIRIKFKNSDIKADQFKTENSSDIIKLKGHVESNINLDSK